MKKILLTLLLLLNFFIVGAQDREYFISIEGNIGQGPRLCGGYHGLQSIQLVFANGDSRYIFGSGGQMEYSNDNFEAQYVFTESNRVTRVVFTSIPRTSGFRGCRNNPTPDIIPIDISSIDCFNRRYFQPQIFPNHNTGSAWINILPKPELQFVDSDVDPSSIFSGCVDSGIDIIATPGFGSSNAAYQWEFLDNINLQTITNQTWTFISRRLREARRAVTQCEEYNNCSSPLNVLIDRVRELEELLSNTPRTLDVPWWRPIENKRGEDTINLIPSDLYPGDGSAQQAILNQNVEIRVNPKCPNFFQPISSLDDSVLDILTIQFLPSPPRIQQPPRITQPVCSDASAEITFFFDRNLRADENLYLNLQELREGVYQSVGNNILSGSTNPFQFLNGRWQYNYNRGGNRISTGRYRIEVGGYDNSTSSPTCLLVPIPNGFPIALPDAVGFTAEKSRDQACLGTNTGSLEITAVSGGSGLYSYSLDNGNTWSIDNFRAADIPFLIDGLTPIRHQVRVRDSNNCLAREDDGVQVKTISISIDRATQIEHVEGAISLPSTNIEEDGMISIQRVSEGVPFTDRPTPYYQYEVLLNGDESTIQTYTDVATNNGYQISRLPVGTHVVRYTDANDCVTDITLPEIVDPVVITNVAVTNEITCFGDVARVMVTATGGESGVYDYALWTGSTIPESDWQDSNIFSLRANTIGYRFIARDRIVTDFMSSRSDPSLVINQPTQIRIRAIGVDHNTVFGRREGAILIGVEGGNSTSYNVTWERNGSLLTNTGMSISGLSAGTYVAIVRDGSNCEVRSDEITINQPDELIVSIRVMTAIPCHNSTGILSAEVMGGLPISSGYQYQWFRDGAIIDGETSRVFNNVQQGNYSVRVEDGFTFNNASVTFTEPDVLSLSITRGDNISCYNGSNGRIVLNPQGGTRPYSFSIDNRLTYISEDDLTDFTIESLISGEYEVWLRDANNCEIVIPQSITLTQPEEIIITPVTISPSTTIGGSDGSLIIEVTGGTGDYRYAWTKEDDATFNRTTKDIDNLSIGAYTVVVTDDNDCTENRTFRVIEPDPMVVRIEIDNPILCHGDSLGELRAIVTGGFPIVSVPSDFEYQWYRIEGTTATPINTDLSLNSIDNLPAGIYRVVSTDITGVSDETTIEITQPEDLVVTLSSPPTHILCYGENTGTIDITVTGGPVDEDTGEYLPYTFRWTKVEDADFQSSTEDLRNITAGTYEVVVIDDNLCTTSLSEPVVIGQPDAALEIYDVIPVNLTGFKTGNGSISLEVRGGTAPYRYSWTDSEDVTYTASTQDIDNLSIGIYTLEVTDENDCTTTVTREITEPNQLIVEIIPISEDEGVQCFGEETVIPLSTTTQGGIGAYTYEWFEQGEPTEVIFTTPVTTRVRAGIYTVVVTDENGNTDDYVYEVIEPEILSIIENVDNVVCRGDANGSIDISVSGGVAPYSYRWSNGQVTEDLSSLRAGNYTVTITDANNCQLQREIEVTQPPRLFVNGAIVRIPPSSSGARDGSITVTIGGGVPSYIYEWRNFSNELQSSTTNVLSNIGVEGYSLTVRDANGCVLFVDNVDLFEPPVLQVNIEHVNVISCFGDSSGSLSAIVEGGVPFNAAKQYNYQWFNAEDNTPIGLDRFLLEGILAGEYYVIVSDAAGTDVTSATFRLTQPDVLSVNFDTDYVNCGDGNDWTIIPQINGGTGPFSYLWSTGNTTNRLENIVAGTYSVEITDLRGCSITEEVTVNVPEPLIITETLTVPTCYSGCDGVINISVQGGAAPYTYLWSNGSTTEDLTAVCAGTYDVIVTDVKGCEMRREIILSNPDELIVNLGEDITLCFEQTIVLNATINDPNANYQWTSTNGFTSDEPMIEVSEAGIYDVLVTDAKGCEASDSIFIDTTTEVISANFIASTQVFVGEKFVIVDNSDPIPDTLDWIFPEEAEVTYEDDNYAELIFETPGEYEIMLQTYRGLCTATTTKTVIVVEKEIDGEGGEGDEDSVDIQSSIDYLVYPNPTTTGRFTVDVNLSKSQPINLKIFNIVNNTLIDSRAGDGNEEYTFEYDMSVLPSGIYFILLETSSASQVRKLIIE
ncbi:T9SS type A sorting domain-containing protein [Aquimarina algiphila]|uniref:T9SS type A sorting domain-containing protein n=1 Tax=Aquimarina algiphila TaxID=2047982 RepID=UPI00232C76ED|nr:T9SS type A sorting domain-containing protein [Aquimarina algiphila]